MRRLFYSITALMLSSLAAMAQNTICATAPAGDSSNRCASTAFVSNAISSTIPLPQDNLLIGNSSGIATPISQPAINNFLSLTPWNDASSVVASPSNFFETSYFGNPATGLVSRYNRVFVGVSALAQGDRPQTAPQWTETYLANWNSSSQLASTSAVGMLAVTGAARTSDFRAWAGSASGGSQGITGMGVNDDAAGGAIACGVCGVVVQTVNTGISLNQFDANSMVPTLVPTPTGGVTGQMAFAMGLTPGAYAGIALENVSAAMYVGGSSQGTFFHKGIIFFDDSLVTSVGVSGAGVAIEMARGQEVRWLSNTGTVDASLYSSSVGLLATNHFSPATNDGAALGRPSTNAWSDLYLADGAVISFGPDPQTITANAAANNITIGGGNLIVTSGVIAPQSNNAVALGTATLSFADLFLASGGVINFNNGAFTITQNTSDLAFSGSITGATTVKTGATTVGALPTCNAGARGTRYFVTDANATTFASTVAGGGANNVPVNCNGTNWIIG